MPFTPLMYLKAAGLAVLLGIFLWGAVVIRGWKNDSSRLSEVEARSAEQIAEARQVVESMKAAQEAAYAASSQYQRELEELRGRPVPVRTVRVLVPASVPATPTAPGRPDATGETGGVVPGGAGQGASRDIGPDLYALALEADRCSAQLRALQGFVIGTR